MDDYRDAIASCCKQLRLSANLADNAFAIQGETHQEYLYNLLSEEIKCRKAARIGKLINSAGFPVQHNFAANSGLLRPVLRSKTAAMRS